jgi:hypothetical protein
MLHEYRELITELKKDRKTNMHFFHIFDRHNHLDESITEIQNHTGSKIVTDIELQELKKEKLHLKDEALIILRNITNQKTTTE